MFGLTKISIWNASVSQIEVHEGESNNEPSQLLYLKTKDAEALKVLIMAK